MSQIVVPKEVYKGLKAIELAEFARPLHVSQVKKFLESRNLPHAATWVQDNPQDYLKAHFEGYISDEAT